AVAARRSASTLRIPSSRRDAMKGIAIVVLAGSIGVIGCSGGGSSPTETKPPASTASTAASNHNCPPPGRCDGIVHAPAGAAVEQEIDRARDEVRGMLALQFPRQKAPDWNRRPAVQFTACRFWVPESNFGATCAGG